MTPEQKRRQFRSLLICVAGYTATGYVIGLLSARSITYEFLVWAWLAACCSIWTGFTCGASERVEAEQGSFASRPETLVTLGLAVFSAGAGHYAMTNSLPVPLNQGAFALSASFSAFGLWGVGFALGRHSFMK